MKGMFIAMATTVCLSSASAGHWGPADWLDPLVGTSHRLSGGPGCKNVRIVKKPDGVYFLYVGRKPFDILPTFRHRRPSPNVQISPHVFRFSALLGYSPGRDVADRLLMRLVKNEDRLLDLYVEYGERGYVFRTACRKRRHDYD